MDEEEGWRFGVDEVGEESNNAEDEIERLRAADPEPGSPSLENAAFVVLGAVTMIAVMLMLLGVL